MFLGICGFYYLSYDFTYADPDALLALDAEPEAQQSLLSKQASDTEDAYEKDFSADI